MKIAQVVLGTVADFVLKLLSPHPGHQEQIDAVLSAMAEEKSLAPAPS